MTVADAPERRAISVLHVDDEPELAELTAVHLNRIDERIMVYTEACPETALERLRSIPVDCVVSDYRMTTMDGLTLLQEVRNRFPDLPFVLYTGRGSERVASTAINEGVDAYVTKETGVDQYTMLAERIATIVEERRSDEHLGSPGKTAHRTGPASSAYVPIDEWDECSETGDSPSVAVLKAVAEREGIDSVDLDPLYESVDPSALDALFARSSTPGRAVRAVTFSYCGYTVTVAEDTEISIVE